MKLIIAEKPSYAKTIATALSHNGEHFNRKDGYLEGSNYIITWQFGHLFRLYTIEEYLNTDEKGWREDVLPFIPDPFKFKVKEDEGIKKQFNIIRKLVNDNRVKTIVEAGDADFEGNLLTFLSLRDIYQKDNLSKPRMRLWSSDQSESTIMESLNNLKSSDNYINYTNEAYTRTCMDFLLGINLTRKFTLLNKKAAGSNELFSIGRCNTSIVDIIYERDKEIKDFKPVLYWQLESAEKTNGEVIKLVDKDKFNIDEEDKAMGVAKKINSNKAIVEKVEDNIIKKEAPKLFSLTSLQSTLSERYKMSMEESLSVVQSLYEAGYVSYPRTNTEYLSTEEIPKVEGIIAALNQQGFNLILKNTKGIFNNERIESHSALIITSKFPKEKELNQNQEIVYSTIKNRFIAKFLNEETTLSQTKIFINIEDKIFELKGAVVKELGFYKYEPLPKSKEKNTLPNLKEGDVININFIPVKKATNPPAKLNIKTLNSILENPFRKEYDSEDSMYKDLLDGVEIGTPATRSVLMQNVKKVGYIVEDKGILSVTDKGIYLIETLRDLGIDISKNKTVEFSKSLKKVFKSELEPGEAINSASKELNFIFELFDRSDKIKGYSQGADELISYGKCPRCGKDIRESSKAFYCEGWKVEPKCTFAIWKENKFFMNKGKKVTKSMVKSLIKDGKVHVTGLKTKEGKKYDADILLDDPKNENGEYNQYVNFKMEFPNTVSDVIGKCPRCGKNIKESSKNFYCEGYKDEPKCEFALWKENKFFASKGKQLSKATAKSFLESGKAHVRGLKKKDNSGVYDCDILMVDEKNEEGKYNRWVNFKLLIKDK